MRLPLVVPVLASLVILPAGCAAYSHEVVLEVGDPAAVWVESPRTHARVEPSGHGTRAKIPGTRDSVARSDDGTLVVDGRTVVGQDGAVAAPPTLDDTEREGDLFRTSVCVHERRGVGCTRSVWLATNAANLTAAYEHDTPSYWLGWLELVGAAALVGGGAAIDALQDSHTTSSGGDLLIVAGVIAAVLGAAQLASDPKNEHVLVEPQ